MVTQNNMRHISCDYYDDITDHMGYFFWEGGKLSLLGANLTTFLIWLLSLVIYCFQISYQGFSVPDLALVAV